jgi:hypothetical protein
VVNLQNQGTWSKTPKGHHECEPSTLLPPSTSPPDAQRALRPNPTLPGSQADGCCAGLSQGTVNGSTTTFTVGGPFLPGTGVVNVTGRDRFGQPAIGGEASIVAIVGTTQYDAVEVRMNESTKLCSIH